MRTTNSTVTPKARARKAMILATEVDGLIRSCPQPDAVRSALEAAILSQRIRLEARTAFYRQKTGNVQPSSDVVAIDRKMWVRIEQAEQATNVWTTSSAKLGAHGGGAVDLHDIVADHAAVLALIEMMGGAREAKADSNAGAPTRRHGTTIDFVLRYMRDLPDGQAYGMKNDTIALILDHAYNKLGGLSLGARGLKDLSAEVKQAIRTPHIDAELVAKLDKIAGIKRN